jgi:cell division protein FtsW (lipid II flippase)
MVNVNRRYVADFDWTLFSLALGLAVFGVLEISSVQPSPGLWRRQLVGVGIGLVLMFLITLHPSMITAASSTPRRICTRSASRFCCWCRRHSAKR